MKLKFFNDFEEQIDSEKISLYLQCPICKRIGLYEGYPSNPVGSTVICDCGYAGMGASFKKAIKKKKAPTMKEKREIMSKYSLMPEELGPGGKLILRGFVPYNAPHDHPSLVKVELIDKLDTILENERPLCRMLKIICEKEKELLPYARDQLIDVISSWGYTQYLIKKATYLGLMQSTRRKRKDNNMTTVNSVTSCAYYTLTNQGNKILRFAEKFNYTAEDVKDPKNQEQLRTQTGELTLDELFSLP